MIGIILAFLIGYWFGKKKETKQSQYTEKIEYNIIDYGYVRDGESVRDLT